MRPSWALPSCVLERIGVSAIPSLFFCALLLDVTAFSGDLAKPEGSNVVRDITSGYGHLAERYLPDFLGVDRSIIGRAGDDTQVLANNAPGNLDIKAGDDQFWTFPKSAVLGGKSPAPRGLPSIFGDCPDPIQQESTLHAELKPRQKEVTVYLTLNVCEQPSPSRSSTTSAPDQLKLYISTSQSNKKPTGSNNDHAIPVDGGYGSFNFTASSDVYIGISAPTNNDYVGIYNYEITASVDDFYAKYNDTNASYFVDSDSHSALVYTQNTTSCNFSTSVFKNWMDTPPAFDIYVHNQEDPAILGLQNSMCGLKKMAQIQGADNVDRSMTTSGGGQPKQQFYVKSLNASSAYYAIVGIDGIDGNSSSTGGGNINGGGTIYKYTNFTTKSSEFIFDFRAETH